MADNAATPSYTGSEKMVIVQTKKRWYNNGNDAVINDAVIIGF